MTNCSREASARKLSAIRDFTVEQAMRSLIRFGLLMLYICPGITPSQAASDVGVWTREFETTLMGPMVELAHKQATACFAKEAQGCYDGSVGLANAWQRAVDWLDGNPMPACLQRAAPDLQRGAKIQRDGWKMTVESMNPPSVDQEKMQRGALLVFRGIALFKEAREKLYPPASAECWRSTKRSR